MRERNKFYEIGSEYFIDYKKIHTDVLFANIYLNGDNNSDSYTDVGRVIGYYYEFDDKELEPIFDNHWAIYIEVYDKKYCNKDLLALILNECTENTYIKKPYYAEMKVTRKEVGLNITDGRTESKDFLHG